MRCVAATQPARRAVRSLHRAAARAVPLQVRIRNEVRFWESPPGSGRWTCGEFAPHELDQMHLAMGALYLHLRRVYLYGQQ